MSDYESLTGRDDENVASIGVSLSPVATSTVPTPDEWF